MQAIGVAAPTTPSLADIGACFLKVGALTVGGGLTMIALMQDQVVDQQDQVVDQFDWLNAAGVRRRAGPGPVHTGALS